ncbi:hypothetical protein [Abyssalbus ytuae]|uniref:Lipoprotein n=1 Tax=Abyssalbus ytuae TaxID=2926907 RepID=A0A9E6ZPS3_9FLAO|nr:hypothetical protein [Abyssalbus ytuae]UOB18664.1 hypothetical protein MQE35_05080 [Abyssalbus ytuae]
MKPNLWNIILITTLLFGCQNKQKLDGNYSMCSNGEYVEVYFKKDSMRIASENESVKLSEWRKVEIKNDTLYFESFGEWKRKYKAEIKYIGNYNIELHNLMTNIKFNLERINENPNFQNSMEFWNGFNKRQKNKNCE